MDLADGTQVSWMNIADEGTSSHLKAIVYPQRVVASIPLQAFTWDLNQCFAKWGLPQKIKVDNGRPIVHPDQTDVPTKAKLWWIGLGIEVIQNTPGRPQENGTVECLQGIMKSWSAPRTQANLKALQKRLDEESNFQRNHYRIPSKNRQTRLEMYPELMTNTRTYAPEQFNIQRVYDYLKKFVWQRRVRNNGEVKLFGQYIYIGKKYAKEPITMTIDPIEHQWECRKLDGTLLKLTKRGIPSEKEIKEFAMMSKNKGTT